MEQKSASRYLQFLSGNGEMARLIRGFDWSATALGPSEDWPQSLLTTLSIMLHSRFPMFLYWGADAICFYNDAYRPSLGNGGKHPFILGKAAQDAWPEAWHIVEPMINQVMTTGEPTWSEDQLIPIFRNGKLEDVYWTFSQSPIIGDTGVPEGVFVTCAETTEKVRTLQELEETNEQLAFAIEAAELGTFDYSPLTNQLYVNDKLRAWFGLPAGHFVSLDAALGAIAPGDRERVEDAIATAMTYSSGGRYDIEYSVIHPLTGTETVVHAKGRAWFNEEQQPYRFNGTVQDVTSSVLISKARLEALAQLSQTSKNYQLALEAGKLGNYEIDLETGVINCSNRCKINFGRESETVVNYSEFTDIILPEDRAVVREAFQKAVTNKTIYEAVYRVWTPAGDLRWIHACAMPMYNSEGRAIQMTGVTANITEQKNAELNFRNAIKELEISQEKLNIVIDASELGTWEINLVTNEVTYSARFLEITGFEPGHTLSLTETRGINHPEEVALRDAALKTAFETGKFHFVGRIIRPDNSIRWVERKAKVFYDAQGKPTNLIGTLRDITDEKSQQEILFKSEQKFRMLADSMPQHVWISDPTGQLYYFNETAFAYSGLTKEEIERDGWLQIIHPDDRDGNVAEWMKSIATGEDFLFEHRFRRHDGQYRWQLSRAIPQKDADGNIQMWVGTSTDIEEQKVFANELERQVRERTHELEQKNIDLEKMNGELQSFAYVSSHDLQEPLRKIQTFAGRILEKEMERLSDTGKDYFNRMTAAAQRMQRLIEDLLTYSRTNTEQRIFEEIELSSLIKDVKDTLREKIEEKHASLIAGKLGRVKVIPFQFTQLLENIIANALKFSAEGRTPVIRISSEVVQGAAIAQFKLPATTQYYHLAISDNGIGFEPGYSEKIFEVFQRLHGMNEYPGTGIGLAIVKKIVENHNGVISATSALNEGATFDIYIPVK